MPNSRTDCIILVRTVKFLTHQLRKKRNALSAVLSLPSGLCLVYVTGNPVVFRRLPCHRNIFRFLTTLLTICYCTTLCACVGRGGDAGYLASQRSQINCGCVFPLHFVAYNGLQYYSQQNTLRTSGESQKQIISTKFGHSKECSKYKNQK